MKINRQQKHVIFFGEDEATRDLAQGFIESAKIDELRCDVWHEFGTGWQSTAEAIERVKMAHYPLTHLILVIDLDRKGQQHIDYLKNEIANSPFRDRVYVIGGSNDVQALQRDFTKGNSIGKMSCQDTGRAIADDALRMNRVLKASGQPPLSCITRTSWSESAVI